MGKRKLYIALISLVFAAVIAVGGCGSSDSGSDYSPVTLGKPTMIVGELPSDNQMLADFETDRVTNRVHTLAEAEVLIINNDDVTTQLDVSPAEFKTFFERGGFVILVEPTLTELNKLSVWTGAHLSAAGDNGAEHFADIYAFYDDPHLSNDPTTGFHTYVLGDHPSRFEGTTVTELVSTVVNESGNLDNVTIQTEFPFEHRPSTKWETKEMVDHFVEWVNNNGPKGSRERLANVKANLDSQLEAAGDVSDLVKAQSVTINKETSTIVRINNSNIKGGDLPKAIYANTYFIYAIYDKDNDVDYYIVEQEAHVQSGNVYMGDWEDYSSHAARTLNSAYYLFDYYTDHYLMSGSTYLDESKIDILQISPLTTTVSSSLTTGFSRSFSGNLGFNGTGATGGISGTISYSNSRTTTIPDVRVVYQGGLLAPFATGANNNARWTYQPALVSVTDRSNMFQPISYSISSPPAISVNTAIFYNSWLWRVHSPGSNTKFTMRCVALPRFAYTQYQNDFWKGSNKHTKDVNVHISDADDYNNAAKTDIVLDIRRS